MPTDNRLDGSGLTFYHNSTLPAGNNMLHNADWGYSLVNQREHTGSVAVDKYCIDRWYNAGSAAGTVTPSSGSHVALASGTVLAQRMEIIPDALFGKTVTFAYQDNSDNVYKTTFTFPSSASGADVTATVGSLSVAIGFIVGTVDLHGVSCASVPYLKLTANSAVNIRRVWLELGKVCHMETTPPVDYATNLLICQRYYNRLSVVNESIIGFAKVGASAGSNNNCTVTVPLSVRLRKSNPDFNTFTTGDADVFFGVNGSTTIGKRPSDTEGSGWESSIDGYKSGGLAPLGVILYARFLNNFTSGPGINLVCRAGRVFEFSADL